MLKNELERTTLDNRSADWTNWTEVDHTQSFSKALHKGHIRIQAKCKQAPPPPSPATQHAFYVSFSFYKHGYTVESSPFGNRVETNSYPLLQICWSWSFEFGLRKKKSFHVTQIFRNAKPFFYLNRVVTLCCCSLRYQLLVCLYWGFNRLFSKGPSPFSWDHMLILISIHVLISNQPFIAGALQRRHGINIRWQWWESSGRGGLISPDAAIVFTACYSEILHKKVWLMTDDL